MAQALGCKLVKANDIDIWALASEVCAGVLADAPRPLKLTLQRPDIRVDIDNIDTKYDLHYNSESSTLQVNAGKTV